MLNVWNVCCFLVAYVVAEHPNSCVHSCAQAYRACEFLALVPPWGQERPPPPDLDVIALLLLAPSEQPPTFFPPVGKASKIEDAAVNGAAGKSRVVQTHADSG